MRQVLFPKHQKILEKVGENIKLARKRRVWVYAHWIGMRNAKCIGILSAHFGKGRKSFSFDYDSEWISSQEQLLLDPDLGWYSGQQFTNEKDN